jgi:hypothetical protein
MLTNSYKNQFLPESLDIHLTLTKSKLLPISAI